MDVLAGRVSFRYCNTDRGSLRVMLKYEVAETRSGRCCKPWRPMDIRLRSVKIFSVKVRRAMYLLYFTLLKTFGGTLPDIKLDPGFKGFYTWCKANDVPVVIVSRHVVIYTSIL